MMSREDGRNDTVQQRRSVIAAPGEISPSVVARDPEWDKILKQ